MTRRDQTKRKAPVTLGKTLDRCQFRSLIARHQPGAPMPTADQMLPQVTYTIAVFGGDPEPIAADTMAELVASIQRGGTILLISDRADLRDYTKREVLAMAGPMTAGSA